MERLVQHLREAHSRAAQLHCCVSGHSAVWLTQLQQARSCGHFGGICSPACPNEQPASERRLSVAPTSPWGWDLGMPVPRRAYDHRLRELVCDVDDPRLPARFGVPRSTAASWVRRGTRDVVSAEIVTQEARNLRAQLLRFQRRADMLLAIVRLLFMLVRLRDVRLDGDRVPGGAKKAASSAPSPAPPRAFRSPWHSECSASRRPATTPGSGSAKTAHSTIQAAAQELRRPG